MLKLIKRASEIPFSDMACIYEESLTESGQRSYPHLDANGQAREAAQDFYAFLQDFLKNERCYIFLWEAENRYVSGLRLEPYVDGVLITGLETAPSYRRRGYASKLLRAVLKQPELQGVRVYSHIHRSNTASSALHLACGFLLSKHNARLVDGTVTGRYDTYEKQVCD